MADVIAGRNQNFDLGYMKINYYLMLGAMVAVSAVAQNNNNPMPSLPPPAGTEQLTPAPLEPSPAATETNAPVKKSSVKHHKKSAKKAAAKSKAKAAAEKPAFSESTVTLAPGIAEVFVSNLNVRGQAGLKGEVVAHLQKGDTVTVLSQINLDTHKADEPAQWAKIALPSDSPVWVRSSFINEADKTVSPKKLNLRAGPSEDYSVVGVLDRGTVVNELGSKGEWIKIAAPTNSFGFVAAMYLKQEASGNVPGNPSPSTETGLTADTNNLPTTPTTVPEPAPIMNQTPPPAETLPPPPANTSSLLPPPIGSQNANAPEPSAASQPPIPAPADTNLLPPPPRIVTHEGYVRDSISLVAPTYYELYSPSTDRAIDYLHSTSTNLDLSRYNGFQIIVTGEEGLDARWKDTPVLTIQRIYVVSTNKPVVPILKSPRASSMH
jgi:uncharacterized protein YgiM (DUF1202 family)